MKALEQAKFMTQEEEGDEKRSLKTTPEAPLHTEESEITIQTEPKQIIESARQGAGGILSYRQKG